MPTPFVTNQKLEVLKLRIKHLSEYLESEAKVEDDGYIDDPQLSFIIQDITSLHDEITP